LRSRLAWALALLAAWPTARLRAQELYEVSFTVGSPAALDSVRRLGIDVVETHPFRDSVGVLAVVADRDADRLLARGIVPRRRSRAPLAAAQEARRAALGARAYTVFRDFDDPSRGVAAYLRGFAASHANVRLDSIGVTAEGRPILVAKVGPADDDPSRPNVIYLATYHAREWVATEMALRLLSWLADSLPTQPGGAALLASRDVWVLPVANPDGYEYTFTTTRLWRKNRRPNGDGSFGVDLNRNHAAFYGLDNAGSSPEPASETYRGPAAESEPETRAIAAFHRAHPMDAAITYHSYAGAILWPWGERDGMVAPDEPVFAALGGSMLAPAIRDGLPGAPQAGYAAGPAWTLYPTNGDYADWAYRQAGTMAFTVELTQGCCDAQGGDYGFEFPDDEAMLAQVFHDNLPFALALLTSAGDPAHATGPAAPGAMPAAGFEAVWPDVRALLPAGTSGSTVQVATDSGVARTVGAHADSLDHGKVFVRLQSDDPAAQGALAARAGGGPGRIAVQVIARGGAETAESGWTGMTRVAGGAEGQWSWFGYDDTLTSPSIPVAGRQGLTLYFWTRHDGSLYSPAQNGRVELQRDGGAWLPVGRVEGSSGAWYPVAMPLPLAAGAGAIAVRFIADGMDWRIDAVAVTAQGDDVFAATASAPTADVEVNQNPVRSGTVTLRWTAAGGAAARVQIFSLLGTPVADTTLGGDPGRWVWDVRTHLAPGLGAAAAAGVAVANGPYLVVVTRGDGRKLRRRLIVAH